MVESEKTGRIGVAKGVRLAPCFWISFISGSPPVKEALFKGKLAKWWLGRSFVAHKIDLGQDLIVDVVVWAVFFIFYKVVEFL